MSTREPLESKQCPDECQTGFNRLRCYAAKVWCKALKVFEPLCALRAVEFSALEQLQVKAVFEHSHIALNHTQEVVSEALFQLPSTRHEYAEWLKLAQDHGFVFNADEQRLARGQLTGFNIIGLAMSYGTTCHCCLGWRALILGVIGFVAGAIIF